MINPAAPDYTNTPVASARPHFGYTPDNSQTEPIVSIVTPFYNVGPIFRETAQSVFHQSLQQWEWLIVNDGSTDNESLAMLGHYRTCDPRVRVLDHNQNRGLSAARNTGFQHASTLFVVQLDGDDLLEPTAVEKWLWFLESYPECAFVKGYSVGFGATEYLWDKGFDQGTAFLKENLTPATCMIRVAVHQAVGGYDESIRGGFEDWDFWLRCANAGYWGANIPEYLDWYRRSPTHADRWINWDAGGRQHTFQAMLQQKYARLWEPSEFPEIHLQPFAFQPLRSTLPFTNRLKSHRARTLILLADIQEDGGASIVSALIDALTQIGQKVTIVTTLPLQREQMVAFTQQTPDVFALPHFLSVSNYPRFIRYLIQSRQIDRVVLLNGAHNYLLLPYLCKESSDVTFYGYISVYTQDVGWVYRYTGLADAVVVSTESIKQRLMQQGVPAVRIETLADRNEASGTVTHLVRMMTHNRHATHALEVLDDIHVEQLYEQFSDQLQIRFWQREAQTHAMIAEAKQDFIQHLEKGFAWQQQQAESWQRESERLNTMLREQQTWNAELEQSKAWLEQQHTQTQAMLQQLSQQLDEQQQWIAELERSQAWLDEQRTTWQTEAERLSAIVAEQQQWVAELEEAKAWHEQQAAHWKEQAERVPRLIRKLTNPAP